MTPVIDRRLVASPVSGARVSDAGRSLGLPPDMLASAAERLTQIALIYAIIYLLSYVIHAAVLAAGSPMPHDDNGPFGVLTTIFVGHALVIVALERKGLIPPERVPDLGLIFMVIGALGIEIGMLWAPPGARVEDAGLSWTVVWLAIFPLIVPATPGKMLLAALVAASLRPLMVLILAARGHPMPPTGFLVLSLFPNAVAVGLAVLGTQVVYGLGRDVSRARQMGSYNLVAPLGQGGMGEVWSAEHQMLARPAAIKLIRPEALGQAEPEARRQLLKRFEREAQATARLSSPHTIHIHDFGVTSDSTFYYVMELLSGLDTEQLVERFGPVPPARAVHILSQICDSLAEAHAEGLVHRDIKPANIYLCKRGVVHDFVKVLDFGLVKAAIGSGHLETAITQQHVATGTPAFMAPEVAMGAANIDGRTDIYSVGCLAYWLLTGQLVFENGNAMQIMFAHATNQPAPPSRRTEQVIPPALDEAVMACLEKDPGHRPASADELRRRLHAVSLPEPWDRDAASRWWHAHLPNLA
jgi:eukaryotic-like serine/threonine-protein kinase